MLLREPSGLKTADILEYTIRKPSSSSGHAFLVPLADRTVHSYVRAAISIGLAFRWSLIPPETLYTRDVAVYKGYAM